MTSWLGDTAANFSKTEHPAHDVRYRIAAEYLDVVQGLWDSWEADALVGSKEQGVFVDPEKLHRLDHKGEFFQVRGPLNIKRTPQGQPVIVQAGASEDGRGFASKRAEVIFTHAPTQEEGQSFYADVKERAKGFGRDPDTLHILPGIAPIVGDTDEDAEAKYRELAALESIDTGLGFLSRTFSDHDFRQYDLDAPFPDVAHIGLNSQQSGTIRILTEVRAENLTLRQVAEAAGDATRGVRGLGGNRGGPAAVVVREPGGGRLHRVRAAAGAARSIRRQGGADPAGARAVPDGL